MPVLLCVLMHPIQAPRKHPICNAWLEASQRIDSHKPATRKAGWRTINVQEHNVWREDGPLQMLPGVLNTGRSDAEQERERRKLNKRR